MTAFIAILAIALLQIGAIIGAAFSGDTGTKSLGAMGHTMIGMVVVMIILVIGTVSTGAAPELQAPLIIVLALDCSVLCLMIYAAGKREDTSSPSGPATSPKGWPHRGSSH